ncbi:MAG: class I SAM-dependent methyltransferase [Sandaracinus sp.]|nr:class I SAM-dependent methyltransferase [Myxococcales bacterium]MCB9614890.1 class I SAM-dependent methyltransferase [Sandaracinus sp.]MCB9618642.1 class I SAM-dependent methyltransferase [Sandaracinus sp.]MCB9632575.1 class I SAM-dependent methyltransferase [Sandaracinus sp.]
MRPETSLLLRHRERFAGEIYALGAPGSDLSALGITRGWNPDAAERAASPFALDEGLTVEAHAEVALVYLPKGNARRDHVLDLASRVAPRVVLVGRNDAGVKSARKVFTARAEGPVLAEHGNHCQLFVGSLTPRTPRLVEKRFEHEGLTFVSLPGVFAEGRLDDATRMLLEVLELPAKGRLLDLGCGAGPIGLHAKARVPALDVTLVDVDDYAVEAARRGAAAASLDVRVLASDGYGAVASERFDRIVTNPPFHRGVGTEYEITRAFVRDAPKRLAPGGELWLVANTFLPWPEVLEETFRDVQVVARDKRFCVWRAR